MATQHAKTPTSSQSPEPSPEPPQCARSTSSPRSPEPSHSPAPTQHAKTPEPSHSPAPAQHAKTPMSSQSPEPSPEPSQRARSVSPSRSPMLSQSQSTPQRTSQAKGKRAATQRPTTNDVRTRKNRRVESPPPSEESEESEDEDADDDGDEDSDQEEVMRIRGRRGEGADREYLLVWRDGKAVWKNLEELKLCPILVTLYDRYIDKYPTKEISYAQFTARDVPSIGLMTDNEYDDCAVHSVEMAFELMGLTKEADCLRRLGGDFISAMKTRSGRGHGIQVAGGAASVRVRGLKLKDLARYLIQEVPKVGWRVDMKIFNKKNWFAGKGTGPMAIASLAASKKLPMGVYLVHAYKPSGRGHCFALRYVNDELVVREEGKMNGIMRHRWITNIRFIREFRISRIAEC